MKQRQFCENWILNFRSKSNLSPPRFTLHLPLAEFQVCELYNQFKDSRYVVSCQACTRTAHIPTSDKEHCRSPVICTVRVSVWSGKGRNSFFQAGASQERVCPPWSRTNTSEDFCNYLGQNTFETLFFCFFFFKKLGSLSIKITNVYILEPWSQWQEFTTCGEHTLALYLSIGNQPTK